jgi:hypothetical protein
LLVERERARKVRGRERSVGLGKTRLCVRGLRLRADGENQREQ